MMRIVFMGTPEFAVASLKKLVENDYNIVGVITSTDKYGGRGGKQLIESDVKKYAVSQNLNILQPPNLKAKAFIKELKDLKADLQIIVAFRMLPEIVWNMPPLGTYNLHGSLLPKYRGAAPIHWAIINGEKETGVTSFKLQHKIDTGDILYQESIPIEDHENTGDVYFKLMNLGADVVLKTVQSIEKGEIKLINQDESLVTKAPKIYKENSKIDFDKDVWEVYNFIRGMSPFPTAWTEINGITYKIQKAYYERLIHNLESGKIITDNKTFLKITTRGGWINIEELQMQGKRKMDIQTFLNGYDFEL